MVYCGRPSRGCQNCKNRRIKCDETRPNCLNCEKTNRECPGFPDEVDLIFRNETPGVKRRARKTSVTGKGADVSTSKANADDAEGYDDPQTPGSRKRRRRNTQKRSLEDDLALETRRDSQQTYIPAHFELQFQLNPTVEQEATTFFFNDFVCTSRGIGSTRGYLDVAASMFDQARERSALRLTTEAVAISAMASCPKQKHLTQLGARRYGRALAATQKAIQDPKEATSDATLLSILLFALYESITSSDHSTPAWTKHVDGAIAIVRARGVKQFENRQSLALFRSVRAQMLANAAQQDKPIESFPGPRGWLSDVPSDHPGISRLLECSMALPSFLSNARYLLACEKTHASTIEVEMLLDQALETQQTLRSWELYMPQQWTHRSSESSPCTINPEQVEDWEAWPPTMHTYENINVASIRNNNRVNEILCSSVVTDTLSWLDPLEYYNDERYNNAKNRVQKLVDDICFSVPFHLGAQLPGGRRRSGEHNVTHGSGGYLLAWPLLAASNVQCIPNIQRRWLRGRLRAISRHYGLEDKTNDDLAGSGKIEYDKSSLETASFPTPHVSSPHVVENYQAQVDQRQEDMFLLDPALLAMINSHQTILDNTEFTTLAPTWTELVTAS